MGDEGIAALASLVSHGRLEDLEELNLSDDGGVTDEGLTVLASAISAGGLPVVETFKMECSGDQDKIRFPGVGAVAYAVINGCPKLRHTYLTNPQLNEEFSVTVNEMVEGMLRAAGRHEDVYVSDSYYD